MHAKAFFFIALYIFKFVSIFEWKTHMSSLRVRVKMHKSEKMSCFLTSLGSSSTFQGAEEIIKASCLQQYGVKAPLLRYFNAF